MLDRKSKYPGRVRLEKVSEGVYDMTRADEPTQEGTSLNKNLFDQLIAAYGTTVGTASELTLTGDGGFQLTDGATIRFKLHIDSGENPTINVDGTGAKALLQGGNTPMLPETPAGVWIVATYSADLDAFVIQGGGTAKIATGSYVGTGDYNPMITITSNTQFVVISAEKYGSHWIFAIRGCGGGAQIVSSQISSVSCEWSEDIFTWTRSNLTDKPSSFLNESGASYRYLLFEG